MKVSVIGAAGYVGGELVRLALGHPELELVQATSRRHAGSPLGVVHPNLRHHRTLRFTEPDRLEPVDVLFTALPKGESSKLAARLADLAPTLVDLGQDHREPDGTEGGGYVTGLPELYRAELAGATRIAVPGCMATAAALALKPLAEAGLVAGDVVVDARTGSSGAGATPSEASHHPERQHALRVYKATGHRHEKEIARLCRTRVRMTVTALPLVRGVQVILHVRPPRPVTRAEIWETYRHRYDEEPFVRLIARRTGVHRLPDPQFLTGSNFTDIGFDVDPDGRRVVVVAALDNLVKGAAGGAVQSLNAAAGLAETTGVDFPGLHPV
ncbi:N-acetyl-gamma-glutamyl-phosphate reductase [Kitasatospora sp. NPDC059673]|uniref:N-acetyl-gamma-glutamyl-phosphate reductase n=1 Tax=Kitasatospora sp. NPDC059673 TaxID=3346901 RepID=UPI0036C068B2